MAPLRLPNSTTLGGGRPGVADLPIIRGDMEGTPIVISCWGMTWRERIAAFLTGRVWLQVMGSTQPPVFLTGEKPY